MFSIFLHLLKTKAYYLVLCLILMHSYIPADAQGGLKGWINRTKGKLDSAIGKKMDNALDGLIPVKKNNQNTSKTENSNTDNKQKKSSGGRPKDSEIKESDFTKTGQHPVLDASSTRYRIAKNLLIDIKGKYPVGYQPKWRFMSYTSELNFTIENWYYKATNTTQEGKNFYIGDYGGKAVIRWSPFMLCDCFADIVVNDSVTVLNGNPQTFEIKNFRRILNDRSTGEPCTNQFNDPISSGGVEGKVTLSANENGDIVMDLMFEIYSVEQHPSYQKEPIPAQVSYRHLANNITIENEMSAEKANEIVSAEQEAKQKQKDYIAKMTKQSDSLMKVIGKKYPGTQCADCYYSSSGGYLTSQTVDEYYIHSGNYAGSHTDYGFNVTKSIQNKCSYDILFVGIGQFYDEEKGYYLKEVTKKMPAGYKYTSDQGIGMALFGSLLGAGSEYSISIQDKYYVNYASVGAAQWLKVMKAK